MMGRHSVLLPHICIILRITGINGKKNKKKHDNNHTQIALSSSCFFCWCEVISSGFVSPYHSGRCTVLNCSHVLCVPELCTVYSINSSLKIHLDNFYTSYNFLGVFSDPEQNSYQKKVRLLEVFCHKISPNWLIRQAETTVYKGLAILNTK